MVTSPPEGGGEGKVVSSTSWLFSLLYCSHTTLPRPFSTLSSTSTMATAQTIPPAPSASASTISSSDSTSPVLSTSPLDSFSSIHAALPQRNGSSSGDHFREREDSYDSNADVLAGDEEGQRRHSMDDSDDALKRYKEGLYFYTSARFDRFKNDLERKQRSAGGNNLQRRSSSQ
ncbi:hypothetical protein JCM6882_007504 [Rhodosporidiobolus microsporus]